MERRGDFLGQLAGYLWFCYLLLEYLGVSLPFWIIVPWLEARLGTEAPELPIEASASQDEGLQDLHTPFQPCASISFPALAAGSSWVSEGSWFFFLARWWACWQRGEQGELRSGSQTSVWKEGQLNLYPLVHITGSVILWGPQGASSWVWSY